MSTLKDFSISDIKQMPLDGSVRDAMRLAAAELVSDMDPCRPPAWEHLESRGKALLGSVGLPMAFLGYAMVCLSNAFWRPQFESIPMSRRLLLLPHCLSDKPACRGHYDAVGLHCAGCVACEISDLKSKAESLGYQVVIAEGTPSVMLKILEGDADAILGVACLDSLEKSFGRIADLGIPYVAVPLLKDGCTETEAEIDQILSTIEWQGETSAHQTRSYLPLLRETVRFFEDTSVADLLSPHVVAPSSDGSPASMTGTEAIALDWLKVDGKRLRPFITVAAYAVAKYGSNVLEPDFETADLVSLSIKRLALAIEAMHKASLVHDDIEDEDEFRYGRRTVHRRYGIAPAVNVGDYLVGLGYRLVAGEASALGADCVSDILGHLSAAHLDLCRGQGAELLWEGPSIRPIDALRIYSLKTAPAFHVALYSGLRAAGLEVDTALLTQFCTYIGEGYQILNDLEDWDADDANHTVPGLDAIAGRPTILRAFAMEAGGGEALGKLLNPEYQSDPAAVAVGVGKLYAECGAFAKAETLLERLRDRAFDLSTKMGPPALQELMSFLVRIVLPKRSAAWAGWMNERKVS